MGQKVRGYIFLIFPVEFDLKANSVRVMVEQWQYKYLGWLLYFSKDKDGNIRAPYVKVMSNDPETLRDCIRIIQWGCEARGEKFEME